MDRQASRVVTPLHADEHITWYVQVYRDGHRLSSCLKRLRTHCPSSRLLVVSDGNPDPRLEAIARSFGGEFTQGRRLSGVEWGGEVVHRFLEIWAAGRATDYLIKIDPDTAVNAPIPRLPDPDVPVIAGRVIRTERSPYSGIQGGCIIVTRAAANVLLASSLLRSPELKPPRLAWAQGEHLLARARRGLTSQDWTLAWACDKLGIPTMDLPGIASFWKRRQRRGVALLTSAIVHPAPTCAERMWIHGCAILDAFRPLSR